MKLSYDILDVPDKNYQWHKVRVTHLDGMELVQRKEAVKANILGATQRRLRRLKERGMITYYNANGQRRIGNEEVFIDLKELRRAGDRSGGAGNKARTPQDGFAGAGTRSAGGRILKFDPVTETVKES